jgi:TPR repeat protein
MYADGQQVAQNINEGFYWYERAAKLGHVGAQAALGNAYYTGRRVHQDLDKAFHLLQRAADQEHGDSQYYLACMLIADGSENVHKGLQWLNRAAMNKNFFAILSIRQLMNTNRYKIIKQFGEN